MLSRHSFARATSTATSSEVEERMLRAMTARGSISLRSLEEDGLGETGINRMGSLVAAMGDTGQAEINPPWHLSTRWLSDLLPDMGMGEDTFLRPLKNSTTTNNEQFTTNFIRGDSTSERPRTVPMRKRAKRLLESGLSEFCMIVVVVANFLLVCVDTDAGARGEMPAPWIETLLVTCLALIVLEFAMRVYVERIPLFYTFWCWFDIFVITSGFIAFSMQTSDFPGFRIIRVLRTCHLFRPYRTVQRMKSFAELAKLVHMMGSCFRALFWSVLMMGFAMSIWGAIAVELIHPFVIELADSHGQWADCERCRRSFASVTQANITLFQTVIAGDSWGRMAIPIIEHQPWTAVIFMGSLLTLVFGVLNLVTAVVVDTAAELREKDIESRGVEMEYEERKEKLDLFKIFTRIDTDMDGVVSFDDLKAGARKVAEFRHLLRVMDIDSADLLQLFQIIDNDNSGEIDAQEFIEAMYRFKTTESKTALRFVKHLVTKLWQRQAGFEEKFEGELSEIASSVTEYKSVLQKGLTNVHEQVKDKFIADVDGSRSKTDDVVQQRLAEQLRAMESTFQEATKHALDIALRSAVETTKHLLQAATTVRKDSQAEDGDAAEAERLVQPAAGEEQCSEAAAEEECAWSWRWLSGNTSRRVSFPSETTVAEEPQAMVLHLGEDDRHEASIHDPEPGLAERDVDEDVPTIVQPLPMLGPGPGMGLGSVPGPLESSGSWLPPEQLSVPEQREPAGASLAPPPPGELAWDDAQGPCRQLRGPKGLPSQPLKPLLPGGFQVAAPALRLARR